MRRLLLLPALLAAACTPGEHALKTGCTTMAANADIPVTPTYDTAQIKVSATGLGVEDLREGTGRTAQPGDVVEVHYTGWFTDGRSFDSSRNGGPPLRFPLGRGQVIPGWDEGVAGMKIGGRRKLVIPSKLGYGAQGYPGAIPPNADLIFDVELCAIR